MRDKFSEDNKKQTKKQDFDDSLLSVINCISKYELDDSYFDNKISLKNAKDENNNLKKHYEKNNSELETYHNGEDLDEN